MLAEGDLVSVDCGVALGGYFADAAITAGVGECSPEARRLVAVVSTGELVYREQVLPGAQSAYDAAAKRLFVTGKRWPKLFEITLVPK